jgi:hypothetical protein
MKMRLSCFNTYLLILPVTGLIFGWGCAGTNTESGSDKEKGQEKKAPRREAILRLHLETNADVPERVTTATIGRTAPFSVTVEKHAFLSEESIVKADLLETSGGYSISLQYDPIGTGVLDQYSTANKGRHLAVWAEFGQVRWIAAPLITKRITDGKVTFTPDLSHEDAEKLIDGINFVLEKIRKKRKG